MKKINDDWKLIITNGTKRIVHAKGCSHIKDWNITGCDELTKFKPSKHFACPLCVRLCYATLGAKDYDKKYKAYEDFLKLLPLSLVKRFYHENKAKTIIVGKKLYVQMRDDNWYIDFEYGVALFHNNYNIRQRNSGDEWSSIGYHEHELFSLSNTEKFKEAIRQICKYDYEIAKSVHNERRQNRRAKVKLYRKSFGKIEIDEKYDPEFYGFY